MSPSAAPTSKRAFWIGWIISAVPAAVLVLSSAMKFARPQQVIDGMAHLGWPDHLIMVLAILELACTAIYLFPRTAVLGAILVTGYLGGAIATHLRLDEAVYAEAGLGILVWLGLYIREARLRALIPWMP